MNYAAFQLELGVVALAILILLLDAFRKTPLSVSKGYAAGVVGLGVLLLLSFFRVEPSVEPGAVVQLDAMAIGFKRMFLALGLGFFILAQNHFDRTKNGRDFLAYQVLMLFRFFCVFDLLSVHRIDGAFCFFGARFVLGQNKGDRVCAFHVLLFFWRLH